jgi:hypothetical protein
MDKTFLMTAFFRSFFPRGVAEPGAAAPDPFNFRKKSLRLDVPSQFECPIVHIPLRAQTLRTSCLLDDSAITEQASSAAEYSHYECGAFLV